MRRLLGPDGCPWDREQDDKSLRRYVLEEACEVIDAIDSGNAAHVCEELGDLALQIVFLSELARARGEFGPDDVVHGIVEKLIRRHPHVFSDEQVTGSEQVVRNWEAIKTAEKGERRLLDKIPRSLPALMRAQRIGQVVSRIGFDWPDAIASLDKVDEEISELRVAMQSGERAATEEELGDLLFAIVNLARHLEIDAEHALRSSADKFASRFSVVEDCVRSAHGGWPEEGSSLSLQELDDYWNRAKAEER